METYPGASIMLSKVTLGDKVCFIHVRSCEGCLGFHLAGVIRLDKHITGFDEVERFARTRIR